VEAPVTTASGRAREVVFSVMRVVVPGAGSGMSPCPHRVLPAVLS
jgi:hypothetical protein